MTTEHKARGGRFATFYVNELFFGIDVLEVQEVLRSLEMTPVPTAHHAVEGLINLRGQIVTALDMRRRMNLPPRKPDVAPMNLVVRAEDGAVSLLVDEIGDVLDVPAEAYEQTPANVPEACRDLIDGVYMLEDRLMLVLVASRALDAEKATN